MKRIVAVFLSVIALVIMISTTVLAAEGPYTEGTLYYTVENESITITGYFGREAEVTVPAMIAGVPVNTIGKGAFIGTNAKKINLPDTIVSIESDAIDAGIEVIYNSNTDKPLSPLAPQGTDDNNGYDNDPGNGTEEEIGDEKTEYQNGDAQIGEGGMEITEEDAEPGASNNTKKSDSSSKEAEADIKVADDKKSPEDPADTTAESVSEKSAKSPWKIIIIVAISLVVLAAIIYGIVLFLSHRKGNH